MVYRIIYGIAVIWLIVISIVLAVAGWVLYGHLWYRCIDWLDEVSDKGMLWVADKILGEHEWYGFDFAGTTIKTGDSDES